MRPVVRKTVVLAPALAAALALAVGVLAGAVGRTEAAQSIDEASALEAAFASCASASITVDRRAPYQASIAGFFERARASGCDYDEVRIADAPRANDEGSAGAAAVANDFIAVFSLPWVVEPAAEDPGLSRNSVRVTMLADGEAGLGES
jgi:hypothetical protein